MKLSQIDLLEKIYHYHFFLTLILKSVRGAQIRGEHARLENPNRRPGNRLSWPVRIITPGRDFPTSRRIPPEDSRSRLEVNS